MQHLIKQVHSETSSLLRMSPLRLWLGRDISVSWFNPFTPSGSKNEYLIKISIFKQRGGGKEGKHQLGISFDFSRNSQI